jgi:hypothetical protein
LHCDDFIHLSLAVTFLFKGDSDPTFIDFIESVNAVELDLVDLTHQKGIHGVYRQSSGAVEVSLDHIKTEIVFVLPSVDINALVICLVSDSIFHFATKHHLRAIHEILHGVLEFRQ